MRCERCSLAMHLRSQLAPLDFRHLGQRVAPVHLAARARVDLEVRAEAVILACNKRAPASSTSVCGPDIEREPASSRCVRRPRQSVCAGLANQC